jgi:hypothetical protein
MSSREATSTAIVCRQRSTTPREALGLRSRPGSRSGEAEVKLAVSRRQVPDGGGEEAPRCEVVGWERHPGGRVGRIGDEAAVELVQRISETLQVCLVTVGRDIDVEGA